MKSFTHITYLKAFLTFVSYNFDITIPHMFIFTSKLLILVYIRKFLWCNNNRVALFNLANPEFSIRGRFWLPKRKKRAVCRAIHIRCCCHCRSYTCLSFFYSPRYFFALLFSRSQQNSRLCDRVFSSLSINKTVIGEETVETLFKS